MKVESIMTGGAARFAAAGLAAAGLAAAGLAAAGFGAVRPARRLDPLVFLKVGVTGGRGRRGFMNVESIMTGGAARFAAAGLAAAGLAAAGLAAAGFGAVRPARRLDPLVFLKVAVTGGRGRRGFMNVESIMPGGQATPARADGDRPTRRDG